MTFSHFLTAYLNINLLVIAGYLCLRFYPVSVKVLKNTIRSQSLLKMHYGILTILLVMILFYPVMPESKNPASPVRIMPVQPVDADIKAYSPSYDTGYFELPGNRKTGAFNTDTAFHIMGSFFAVILFAGLIKLLIDIHRLYKIKKKSYLIRKYFNILIYANDEIKIPFSYWLPGRACIIIPTELAPKKSDLKITIYHELQHHRNGDTKWIYFIWFLRSICILNPCVHLWSRLISELQEFACDEVLVDRKKIDSQEYASCLFEAARSASDCTRVPVCATGLTFMVQRQLLKRRVERMFKIKHNPAGWKVNLCAVILIAGCMLILSCAAKRTVKDLRITMEQAVELAQNAAGGPEIPVVVNDLVLKELNTYMGTSEGREIIRGSLERMEYYREDIKEKINQYGVPEELLAIPLIESGYRKMQKNRSGTAAGLWQFIESTAHKFGLKKDEDVDERFDPAMSTDAAMRYLMANKDRFNNWPLSVIAYNIGEKNVQKIIDETGSSDVWDVAEAVYDDDKNYYAKFIAAVIIIKNTDFISQYLDRANESGSVKINKDIKLDWPIKGWVSSKYGYRTSPFTGEKKFHYGTDISARTGTPITAAASGTVKDVKSSPLQGNYLVLQHKNSFKTLYSHCHEILVKEGQAVKKGDTIATCGNTGKSTGPHLHFEVIVDSNPVNPEEYLAL